jgi:hypothetical protein
MIDGIGGTLLEALANGTVVTIFLRSSGSSFLATRHLITLTRCTVEIIIYYVIENAYCHRAFHFPPLQR